MPPKLTNLFIMILMMSTVYILVAALIDGPTSKKSDEDLVADGTTIIFRPLFVYKMQEAKKLERQKIREWQRLHPNENYYEQNRYPTKVRSYYSIFY